MDWAINPAGNHVRPGTPGAYGYSLRCPVCKASVYHRHGVYNRPHFAHYSGNFNRACELYNPGTGNLVGVGRTSGLFVAPSSFDSPALIWSDSNSVPLSLQLRLPRVPPGYSSTLSIFSSLGRRVFAGEDLTRTLFAQIPLQEPPARVETSPRDPATELRIEAALRQFRLSGNYFRATASGGVLESPDSALELGEEYFFVSQRPLATPYPPALILTRGLKQHRSWMVYYLRLRDDPDTRDEDIADLNAYLGRTIALPRHRIDVVWPPPHRFDADGAPVFSGAVGQLIARSNVTPPKVETGSSAPATITDLGRGLYLIAIEAPEGEAIVWTASGSVQRIRFESMKLTCPVGVMLSSLGGATDLMSPTAVDVAGSLGPIDAIVPSELLWRRAKFNGRKLRPLPSGTIHQFEGPLQDIDIGSFGSVSVPQCRRTGDAAANPWYVKVERVVSASVGPIASANLKSIRSKHQAVRWAVESKAMHLLPLVLSAFSAEVGRGIS
jgi:hypothetical protein